MRPCIHQDPPMTRKIPQLIHLPKHNSAMTPPSKNLLDCAKRAPITLLDNPLGTNNRRPGGRLNTGWTKCRMNLPPPSNRTNERRICHLVQPIWRIVRITHRILQLRREATSVISICRTMTLYTQVGSPYKISDESNAILDTLRAPPSMIYSL